MLVFCSCSSHNWWQTCCFHSRISGLDYRFFFSVMPPKYLRWEPRADEEEPPEISPGVASGDDSSSDEVGGDEEEEEEE